MVDLWPDDIGVPAELKAPVTILKEQASLLGKKTQNLVEAEVVRIDPEKLITTLKDRNEFDYIFLLVAPALSGYSYRLFEATNGIELYPVNIYPGAELYEQIRHAVQVKSQTRGQDIAYNRFVATSEDELLEILRHIFTSEKTRQIIAALLAQAGVGEEELPF